MPQPSLSDTAFNAQTISEAIAQYVGDQNTTLGTIITNLANNYAQLQTDIETNLKADSNFITNIASQVQGGAGMKFVGLGKVAVNFTGTEGTDYPASGKTWIFFGLQAGYWSTGNVAGFSHGGPVGMISRNSNGDYLQADGSYGSSQPTSWIVRDTSPDVTSTTSDTSFNSSLTVNLGADDLSNNTDGTGNYNFAMPTHTIEIETVS